MTNTPMTKEDVLLDLYKIYAYNPNDAVGNPLTPFGNFCEGYQASQAQQASVIAELQAEVQRLHTGDNLKAMLDADTYALMKSCNEMHKTVLERDKTIAELVEALELADEAMMWDVGGEPMPSKEIEARAKIKDVLAKVKGKL